MKKIRIGRILGIAYLTVLCACGLSLPARDVGGAEEPREEEGTEVDALRPKSQNPQLAIAAFDEAKNGFLSQLRLLSIENAYEQALSRGDHPEKPSSYTSTSSRKEVVMARYRSLRGRTQVLKRLLSTASSEALGPAIRAKIADRIAYLPAAEGQLPH